MLSAVAKYRVCQYEAQARPCKHGDKVRGGESQHEVVGEVFHGIGHHTDEVAMIFDAAGSFAVSPAGKQEEQKKRRDQALIEGRHLRFGFGSFIYERRAGPEGEKNPQGNNKECC